MNVEASLERISAQTSVSQLLTVASTELAGLLDARRVSVSRVIGDLLVELSNYDRSGQELPLELFLVTDYPITQEVIEQRVPRIVLRRDPDADEAETALLEKLGFESLLMLPLHSGGQSWGLVEIYGDGREFLPDEVEHAAAVVAEVGTVLAGLEGRA